MTPASSPRRGILLDALTLRALLSGRPPSAEGFEHMPSLFVTWPEYLFLVQLATSASARHRLPNLLRAVSEIALAPQGPYPWLVAFFDLGRLQDIYGIGVSLAMPRDERAPEVLTAALARGLSVREATNLIVAKSEQLLLVAHPAAVSTKMRQALDDNGVPYSLGPVEP